ncbi:3-hydroxy-3-methylglutaryl-coenzyme A reductase [Pestalotiopsis fici W106-1]|uniref:3-hydroxy-3-methylglutaryl coenzyme A reductase n=1 Tax=Pestalotiopsis fici (strain W106-1 / CGMCC3.15140) TaxID=1229662 RepID=W3WM89_PESFW|nr:3-hydroxy-3-methylglutaryl-coenzyme A reductase [Pestalotiopsis fici W106-1]ETS75040.1 3-hydroxy-3-methylglutaryl-coenzyme A reductase [Pestalotiopsis fici W106-1]
MIASFSCPPAFAIACLHPIYTICVVAILASTTYVGVVKESLVDVTQSVRRAEWDSLVEGSRSLIAGPETSWKWQNFDSDAKVPKDADHLALITLVFPESSPEAPQTAPSAHIVPLPNNLSVAHLPSTSNTLTTYAQDSALAFAVKYSQAAEFIAAAQEIPNDVPGQESREIEDGRSEKKMWIIKAARGQTGTSLARWAKNAWTDFLDLLKNADTLDIIIMVLGYLSMHLTFVSLFLSMRKLGSNVWLAVSVLFSSTFAFLFGLNVTTRLGVPISVVLLSEGLPFLVVTIGFEKNIVLTKAVLSHALDHRRPEDKSGNKRSHSPSESLIQYAVHKALKDTGFEIVRDYVLEILLLIVGANFGVQGGLQQFCFLAAWILFFDCLLLFTFYTAILCIKLEINRIKRHVELRKALEDDGLSRRVAENVATNNEGGNGKNVPLFGQDFKSSSVPKFKFWMIAGFFAINIVNLCTIPFRTPGSDSSISSWAGGLGGVVTTPPVDPFKVASNGLDEVLFLARGHGQTTVVTVLTPIKYELEFPSIHYAVPSKDSQGEDDFSQLVGISVGGRMVGGLLESLEDPILSKWIVIALAMSVALNGYLFNVARSGIKDPNVPTHPVDPKDLAAAERFNETSASTPSIGQLHKAPPRQKPATPASTDDEADQLLMKSRSTATSIPTPRAPLVSRSQADLDKLLAEKRIYDMTDDEVVALSLKGKIPGYALEKSLKNTTRAVKIRRSIISRTKATSDVTGSLESSKLPFEKYNWDLVLGACCENVIGYMPLPVGVAGPLVIDGQSYFIPMATTEGVLVASASRGCKAINAGGGAVTVITGDGMTRGPALSFETLERAGAAKAWIDSEAGQALMKKAFDSTSRFARLQTMKTALAGTNLYVRFKTTTGDAMGMNMISKGVEHALNVMATEGGFEDMSIISVSGNYCIDKKPAALNWIDGRGKGIVAEAIIPGDVVKSVLKSDVDSLVELNISKNLIGSAMAASVGGFNAHAANIVAAVFLATGQDPAQVVESANCITIMKNLRGSLQISVSMPSIEVGTLGGGTILEPQSAMLDMLGVRGPHPTTPGENSRRLARIIGAAVLAGELSLCSALAAGHLVRAHMAHNRSAPPTRSTTPAPTGAMTPVGLTMTSAAEKAVGSVSAAAAERAKR